MRTREIFKYLAVMIMALNTSVNAMAQQRNLKVYFNQYVSDGVAPTMLVTDDYNKYDLKPRCSRQTYCRLCNK